MKHVYISGRWPTSRQRRLGRYDQRAGLMPQMARLYDFLLLRCFIRSLFKSLAHWIIDSIACTLARSLSRTRERQSFTLSDLLQAGRSMIACTRRSIASSSTRSLAWCLDWPLHRFLDRSSLDARSLHGVITGSYALNIFNRDSILASIIRALLLDRSFVRSIIQSPNHLIMDSVAETLLLSCFRKHERQPFNI